MKNDIEQILKKNWGYDAFRPLQKEIIESVLQGKDTLAVLPTGGGKSICFQVPALAKEGICIVISPLIALMKDQVDNLKKRGIPALLIHSGMKRSDVLQTLKNATHSYFKFLYVSPERIETSLFLEYLPSLLVNLIAVDEAHCISQWGYDFRPSFLRIASLRKELPNVPVLALTASATPLVQKDICEKLEFKKASVFRQSFERKNLSYSSFLSHSRLTKLVHIINKVPGTAIVYCKSRKRTVEIKNLLEMHGISAGHYHAGLSQEERNQKQKDWIENKTRVIVCTNAFGMGIDKPDVRLVVHVDVPDCLENYYQEAGRAGRDGRKSYAVLLYTEKDIQELEELHTIRFPSIDQIRKVYHALVNFLQMPSYTGESQSFDFNFENFIRHFKLKSQEALFSLKALEQDGWFDINEKSFTASSVLFTCTKNELEEFEKAHPVHEVLLTYILRNYEGVFDYPAFISEFQLARLVNKDEDHIRRELRTIASYGIIRYTSQNESPQIIFRKHRVPSNELEFKLKPYEKRKELFIERVSAMINFANTQECRSVFISRYFGDVEAKECGVCDNCLQKKASALSPEEFEEISGLITQTLSHSQMTASQLMEKIKPVRKEKMWKVIEFLQSEEKITADKSGLLHLKA